MTVSKGMRVIVMALVIVARMRGVPETIMESVADDRAALEEL